MAGSSSKDSLDNTVGIISTGSYWYSNPQERLTMKREGEVFTLPFNVNGFGSFSYDEPVFFSSPDCTGTPLFSNDSSIYSVYPVLALVKHGTYYNGQALIRDLSQPPASVLVGSQLSSGVCSGTGYPDTLRPGKMIDVSDIVGPFHLE